MRLLMFKQRVSKNVKIDINLRKRNLIYEKYKISN